MRLEKDARTEWVAVDRTGLCSSRPLREQHCSQGRQQPASAWGTAEAVVLSSHDYLPLRARLDMNSGSLVPQEGDVFLWEMHQGEEACSPDVDSLLLIQEALRTLERQNESVLRLVSPNTRSTRSGHKSWPNPRTSPTTLPPSTLMLTSAHTLYKEPSQSVCLCDTRDPNPLLPPLPPICPQSTQSSPVGPYRIP